MTTGMEDFNEGELQIEVDGVVVVDDMFNLGDVAIDACYKDVKCLTLTNSKKDGWAGKVEITDCGKPASLTCAGCSQSSSIKDGFIYVDGDDGEEMGESWKTQCINGDTCSILWDKQSCSSTSSFALNFQTFEF